MRRPWTRPRRAAIFAAIGAIVWLGAAALLFGRAETTWRATAGGYGTRVERWGALHHLVVTRGPVAPDGTRGATFRSDRTLRPVRLVGSLLCLGAASALAVVLFRRGVRRGVLRGRCDECGYDLRGAGSDRCPECGTPQG